MTDFLDKKRHEITDRLKELEPQVEEYRRLEDAASALAKVGGSASTTTTVAPRRRGPGRPRGSKTTATSASLNGASTSKPTAKRGRRRRKRTGEHAAQALKLIVADPGITIPALGKKMGIKGNYLYTVVPSLERAGKVRKAGSGWHPKEATPAAA